MNVLHFSTDDISGGAAKAAYRIHSFLRDLGHTSKMIVRYKNSDDHDVIELKPVAPSTLKTYKGKIQRRIPFLPEQQPNYTFNLDIEPDIDIESIFEYKPGNIDIVCLYWISKFLTVKTIRKIHDHYRVPIVWILADQEPVTGGCHYSFGCRGFIDRCGNCPQLEPRRGYDRSRIIWQRKRRYLKDLPIVFISPTQWGAQRVRESSLFRNHRLEIIPLSIDTNFFAPFDKSAARAALDVPSNKRVIFFGATYLEDKRKGMSYLVESLNHLRDMVDKGVNGPKSEDIWLLVAGLNSESLLSSLPFAYQYLGLLDDEVKLARSYQAADIFACPSVEDGGPMMISEALLCGTPVIAFESGIAPELIKTGMTGYLAKYRDSLDFANGMCSLLTCDKLDSIGAGARDIAVRTHSPEIVMSKYLRLFDSLVQQRNGTRSTLNIGDDAAKFIWGAND